MAASNEGRPLKRWLWIGSGALALAIFPVVLGADPPERAAPASNRDQPAVREKAPAHHGAMQATVQSMPRAAIHGEKRKGPNVVVPADGGPVRVDTDDGPVWINQVSTCPDDPDPKCLVCHCDIESATINMGFDLDCTFCHGGDPNAITMETAHVLPMLDGENNPLVIRDKRVQPLDLDVDYQRFINPSNLRVLALENPQDRACGFCHPQIAEDIVKSMMATAAGHYAGGLYQNNVVDTKTPIYGTFAVTDEDGYVPTEQGAVQSLEDLLIYSGGDPLDFATHFAAVPSQACARCHLWSRGKGYRGAENADGVYRADGCAACHMLYSNEGYSDSGDMLIDHGEKGHPMQHVVTKEIPTEQCVHCHHRGARIGLNFTGRAQMPPRLPSGPGVPGTSDVKFNSNYHYTVADTNPPDIHHQAGLHCIDCHVASEIMGDGNIYGHMDQATKIECRTCHGTPSQAPTMLDNDGVQLPNLSDESGSIVLTSKVTGATHIPPPAMEVVASNQNAACAMNDNHLKDQGGLECYACHSSWVANCFGCHFERDETQMGFNLMTGELEVGKASTGNKIFESMRIFSIGPNSEGRVAPYVVACHPIADVTAPDGTKILDFVMPVTVNGLSGLAHNPVNPHTVRGAGDVRSCAECHRSPPSLGLGSGNYAIARVHVYAAGADGVTLYDRDADPMDPTPGGMLPGVGAAHAVAMLPHVVHGTAEYVYVARGTSGVEIHDVRTGSPPGPVATIPGVNAIDVSRVARYLYVVDSGVGVRIYDNDDPSIATLVATVPITTATRVVPWGIHLFVAAGDAGLVIVNVADHEGPWVEHAVTGMDAGDVQLYAHYQPGSAFAVRAYVADPGYGVRIVDLLPDYDTAEIVGGLPLVGATGLDAYTRYVLTNAGEPSREHDYLYVAAGVNGLHVYDMTDPENVHEVASVVDLGGVVTDVDVSSQLSPPGTDDYAVLANEDLGLQVVDVTDPVAPINLGTVAESDPSSRVMVEVQQMDRFLDEQGNQLKENSHPFTGYFSHADIVNLLSTSIDCITQCDADADGDGMVGASDIVAVIMDWGTDGAVNGGDVNGDGIVDVNDLVAVIVGWGPC